MNNDGPAFPHNITEGHGDEQIRYQYSGMTLRDYFAAQTMAGLSASVVCEYPTTPDIAVQRVQWAAGLAFALADAMLAERAK